MAIFGPSGSEKITLLNIICRLDRYNSEIAEMDMIVYTDLRSTITKMRGSINTGRFQ